MKNNLPPIYDRGEHEVTALVDNVLPIVVLRLDTQEIGVCLPVECSPAELRRLLEFALAALLTSLEKLSDAEYRQ